MCMATLTYSGDIHMTNVSNALIWKVKQKDIHGASNRDKARMGVCDPRPIPVKADSIGLRKDADALNVTVGLLVWSLPPLALRPEDRLRALPELRVLRVHRAGDLERADALVPVREPPDAADGMVHRSRVQELLCRREIERVHRGVLGPAHGENPHHWAVRAV